MGPMRRWCGRRSIGTPPTRGDCLDCNCSCHAPSATAAPAFATIRRRRSAGCRVERPSISTVRRRSRMPSTTSLAGSKMDQACAKAAIPTMPARHRATASFASSLRVRSCSTAVRSIRRWRFRPEIRSSPFASPTRPATSAPLAVSWCASPSKGATARCGGRPSDLPPRHGDSGNGPGVAAAEQIVERTRAGLLFGLRQLRMGDFFVGRARLGAEDP